MTGCSRTQSLRRFGLGLMVVLLLLGLPVGASGAEPAIFSEVMIIRSPQAGPGVVVQHEILMWNIDSETAESIELPIPWQATDVQVEGVPEEALLREADRLVDMRPLGPGEERSYSLTYSVPTPSVPIVLQRRLPYPILVTQLWLEERFHLTGIGVELTEQGIAHPVTGEGSFDVYSMVGVRVSDRWQVVVAPALRRAGLPVLGSHLFHGDPGAFLAESWVWALVGIGLVVIGGTVLTVRRRGPGSASRSASPSDAKESHLKEMIVELDLLHRRGGVRDEEYRERRAALREELLHHLLSRKSAGDARHRNPEVQGDV